MEAIVNDEKDGMVMMATEPKKKKRTMVVTTVKTTDLLAALEFAVPFSEAKSALPILSTVLLSVGADSIMVTGTNLEVSGQVTVAARGGDPFSLCVSARRFGKYVRQIKDDEVRLLIKGTILRIEHGNNSVAQIEGLSADNFPNLQVAPAPTSKLSGLLLGIPRALSAVSKNESQFTLNGALLDGGKLISTDGHRMSVVEIQNDNPEALSLICKDALWRLSKCNCDVAEFSQDETCQYFRMTGDRLIVSRKLTGNFPEWKKIFPELEPKCVIDSALLDSVGSLVAVFANDASRMVLLDAAGGSIKLSSSISETGSASAEIARGWSGDNLQIAACWDYIHDFCQLASGEIGFSATKPESPMLFRVPDWAYLLMPMRR